MKKIKILSCASIHMWRFILLFTSSLKFVENTYEYGIISISSRFINDWLLSIPILFNPNNKFVSNDIWFSKPPLNIFCLEEGGKRRIRKCKRSSTVFSILHKMINLNDLVFACAHNIMTPTMNYYWPLNIKFYSSFRSDLFF